MAWLYVKVHPGTEGLLDHVIRFIVQPVVDQLTLAGRTDRWFFIRYVDDAGPHIRLRVRVAEPARHDACNRIEQFLDTELPRVCAMEPANLRRLVPVALAAPGETASWFSFDQYEPEWDKYGGSKGVAIAEELFETSSVIAAQYLSSFASDMSDRGALAIVLMQLVSERGLPEHKARQYLWERTLVHWTGGSGDARTVATRAALMRGASLRMSQMEALVARVVATPHMKRMITVYKTAIDRAFQSIRDENVPVPYADLCFHYIHMMNNRLGIWPVEEAYLAAFLRQGGSGTTASVGRPPDGG